MEISNSLNVIVLLPTPGPYLWVGAERRLWHKHRNSSSGICGPVWRELLASVFPHGRSHHRCNGLRGGRIRERPVHISNSGSQLSLTGIANAFAKRKQLREFTAGLRLQHNPVWECVGSPGNGEHPADALASCIKQTSGAQNSCLQQWPWYKALNTSRSFIRTSRRGGHS
jgi:hypothetical protein